MTLPGGCPVQSTARTAWPPSGSDTEYRGPASPARDHGPVSNRGVAPQNSSTPTDKRSPAYEPRTVLSATSSPAAAALNVQGNVLVGWREGFMAPRWLSRSRRRVDRPTSAPVSDLELTIKMDLGVVNALVPTTPGCGAGGGSGGVIVEELT